MLARRLVGAAALLLVGRAAPAQWVTVYANDFDDGDLAPALAPPGSFLTGPAGLAVVAPGPGCSSAVHCTPSLGIGPAGAFENDRVAVGTSGAGLAPHTMARLRFTLLAFDTWDGNHPVFGPDFLLVGADGVERFRTTFSHNVGSPQSFPDPFPASNPSRAGAVEVGTVGVGTSVFAISLTIAHTASDVSFFVEGENLQGGGDESWRIDDLRIDVLAVSSVPEPSTAALVAAGLLAAAVRAGAARRAPGPRRPTL